MIDKVEKDFGLFSHVFEGIEGQATDFIPQVQFHVYNNLSHSVSVNQLHQTYPPEAMHRLAVLMQICTWQWQISSHQLLKN
ncbi:MAG: hypothetical protein R6U98_36475 [Pirellulaceae bacterium]